MFRQIKKFFLIYLALGFVVFLLLPLASQAAGFDKTAASLCIPNDKHRLNADLSNSTTFFYYYDQCKRAPTYGECACDADCQEVQCNAKTKPEIYQGECAARDEPCAVSTSTFSDCCKADTNCVAYNYNQCSNPSSAGEAAAPNNDVLALQNRAADVLNQPGMAISSPEQYAGQVVKFFSGLMGAFFMLNIIIAGIIWMTSFGNSEKVELAKKIILWSVVGVLVVLSSYMIVAQIFNFL